MEYFERIADKHLQDRLQAMGAVLIEGPKWCGKTTTAEQQARSVLRMQDPDNRADYLATAAVKPSNLLIGETPRLLDEWQDAPVLWDAVRTICDKRRIPGQFILTGSNSIDEEKIFHSGTGRISRLKMYPMSLWESKESNGSISLHELFDNPKLEIEAISDMTVNDLIFSACRGGWPASLKVSSPSAKLMIAKDYVQSVCKTDISRVDGVKRKEKLARQILLSYARNISTLAKTTSILADVTVSDSIECSRSTFDDYVSALEKLFVIQDVNAWCPAIRSKTAIQSGSKRTFCDPSIAIAMLGMTPEALQMQLKTFGFFFEQMCIRDLRAYSDSFFSNVGYYRDRYGLESDIVLHLNDGRYALIECKLGSSEIENGAGHLIQLHDLIIEHNKHESQVPIREPDLKIVLTGGQYAYTRSDGVYVIPLACLKP
ncbi:MAG: ATP-binding protein [Candidatus Cryptobacteroides sp.]